MKFSYTILVIILIVLLFLTLSGSCGVYMPYSESGAFSQQQFKYEGMDNIDPEVFLGHLANGSDRSTIKSTGINIAPYGDEKPIDIFSGTPGSIDCESGSSNLSNSKGALCLNKDQTRMLQTRGGNATGGDFQIGK